MYASLGEQGSMAPTSGGTLCLCVLQIDANWDIRPIPLGQRVLAALLPEFLSYVMKPPSTRSEAVADGWTTATSLVG